MQRLGTVVKHSGTGVPESRINSHPNQPAEVPRSEGAHQRDKWRGRLYAMGDLTSRYKPQIVSRVRR